MALMAEGGLDPLYMQILADAHSDHNNNFQWVIGTVMLLTKPMPIMFLTYLLQLQPVDIVLTLQGLQSILMISSSNNKAIQLFHMSLPQDNLYTALMAGDGLDPLYAQTLADAHSDHNNNFKWVISTVMH